LKNNLHGEEFCPIFLVKIPTATLHFIYVNGIPRLRADTNEYLKFLKGFQLVPNLLQVLTIRPFVVRGLTTNPNPGVFFSFR
jgi:hypothetical protein